MPQRFLRPGITASLKWNAMDWFSQSFYIRIITIVDDFGRSEGDPILLRGICFPVGDNSTEPVPMKLILSGCEQMSAQALVVFFAKQGKKFLQITNWQERARSDKSKFPEFDSTCEQLFPSGIQPDDFPPEEKAPKANGFHAPTIEEVLLLGEKAALPEVECRKFHAFYESKGWMIGKNRMKSPGHAIAGWKLRWQESSVKSKSKGHTLEFNENP